MKPATNTLTDLFGADVRHLVPLYQRPYVWQRKRHWEPLWQDVVAVAEHNLAGEGTRGHFLGAVVLEQDQTHPGEITRRLVIDGQQRLTTLQLLLSAAAREAAEDGADAESRLLHRLVANDPDMASGDDRFKVWPTNADRAEFVAVMSDAAPRPSAADVDEDGDGMGPLRDAHEFFRAAVRRWVREGGAGDEHRIVRHKAVRVTLTSLLHVVSINLEGGDDAQVIFETLNARGTPLLAMDLVKNAVFHRAESEAPERVDALHNEVWEPELGRTYWRELQRQGRLNRPRAELFLMHWLTMRLRDTVAATELFAAFRGRVLDAQEAPPTADLIAELCRDARTMRDFDALPPTAPEGRFFRRLAVLDTTTLLPLALLLFSRPEVTAERRRAALAALESWLVRRMLCGLTSKNYNRSVVELLELVWKNLDAVDEALGATLDGWDGPINRWPGDEEVVQALTTRPMYGWIAQRRVVLVLEAVEHARRQAAKTESILDPDERLSIEHVMPQEWRTHWPLGEVADAIVATNERDGLLHRIGNLTLVTSPLNASLSNAPWDVKRTGLTQHSLLRLNAELAEHAVWDEEAIRARSASLAHEICAIWAPPPTARGLPSDQRTTGERVTYPWTIGDLVAADKLRAGEQLRPRPGKYSTPATVGEDGTLEVGGEIFQTPSAAAKRVTGTTAVPGWHFWCAERDGSLVQLDALREQLGAEI